MAQRGRPIPATTVTQIKRLAQATSISGSAREAGVARNTAKKYLRPPKPLDGQGETPLQV